MNPGAKLMIEAAVIGAVIGLARCSWSGASAEGARAWITHLVAGTLMGALAGAVLAA